MSAVIDVNTAKEMHDKGVSHFRQHEYKEALELFHKAITIYELLSQDSADIAFSYVAIAKVYDVQGLFDDALASYEKALKLYIDKNPQGVPVASCYNSIAFIYYDRHDYGKAEELMLRALEIEEIHSPLSQTVANSYNNLAELCVKQGKLTQSLSFHEKALAIEIEIDKYSSAVASSYIQISEIYRQLGKGKVFDSYVFLQKALGILNESSPGSAAQALAFYRLGCLYRDQKDWVEAFSYFEKSYAIRSHKLKEDHPDLITTAYEASNAAFHLSNFDEAERYVAIVIEKDASFKFGHSLHGDILKARGNYSDAFHCYKKCLELDPGYGDGILGKLQVMEELDGQFDSFSLDMDLNAAFAAQPTDYSSKRKEMIEHKIRKMGYTDVEVELPAVAYHAGTQAYTDRLHAFAAKSKVFKEVYKQLL